MAGSNTVGAKAEARPGSHAERFVSKLASVDGRSVGWSSPSGPGSNRRVAIEAPKWHQTATSEGTGARSLFRKARLPAPSNS